MAENKKSVLVYTDWIDKFEALTDEEAGKLIKHFFRYVNDMNPEAPDRTTQLMFIDIRNTLKRDLKKYEGVKKKLSNSGKLGNLKRYNSDLYSKVVSNELTLNEAEAIATQRKNSQGDEDNRGANKNVAKLAVSDSVSVSVSDIDINNNNKRVVFVDSYDEYKNEIAKVPNTTWIENFYSTFKLKDKTLSKVMDDFIKHKRCLPGPPPNNINDFKIHFYNWCLKVDPIGKLNDYKKNKPKQIGSL